MSDQPTLPEEKKKPGRRSNAELAEENAALREKLAEQERRNDELTTAQDNRAMNEDALAKMSGQRRAAGSAPNEKGHDSRANRRPIGQAKRLDADRYVESYPNKKLLWVNDLDGQVQRWIDNGAEPVPVETPGERRVFEGITDRHESKWVQAIGGDDGHGGVFYVYLLMIDPDRYHELVTEPERDRQANIHRRIKGGGDQSDMDSTGPRLPSYAPNLPTGGTGFDESRDAGV